MLKSFAMTNDNNIEDKSIHGNWTCLAEAMSQDFMAFTFKHCFLNCKGLGHNHHYSHPIVKILITSNEIFDMFTWMTSSFVMETLVEEIKYRNMSSMHKKNYIQR
jgi:hypothetical protein